MPFARRSIIQTCREHHAVLRDLLDRFGTEDAKDPESARQFVERFGTVLKRHLELEDERLYPALEELDHPEVAATARRYRQEMGGLRGHVFAFVERWRDSAAIAAAPVAFAQGWAEVRAALERRMAAEDDDLYEMAERVLSR